MWPTYYSGTRGHKGRSCWSGDRPVGRDVGCGRCAAPEAARPATNVPSTHCGTPPLLQRGERTGHLAVFGLWVCVPLTATGRGREDQATSRRRTRLLTTNRGIAIAAPPGQPHPSARRRTVSGDREALLRRTPRRARPNERTDTEEKRRTPPARRRAAEKAPATSRHGAACAGRTARAGEHELQHLGHPARTRGRRACPHATAWNPVSHAYKAGRGKITPRARSPKTTRTPRGHTRPNSREEPEHRNAAFRSGFTP